MEEQKEMGSAQPNDAVSGGQGGESPDAGGADQEQGQKPTPRMLGEIKSLKQQLAEEREAREALQLQKIEAEKDWQTKAEQYKNLFEQEKSARKEDKAKLARATVGNQVEVEATKMGCLNTDDLLKIIDMNDIPVDPETYRADTDAVRVMLEDVKKSRPFFFAKQAPTVHDVTPQNKVLNQPTKSFGDMSREELNEQITRMKNEKAF